MQSLLEDVVKHQLLLQRYLKGEEETKRDVLKLQTAITLDLDAELKAPSPDPTPESAKEQQLLQGLWEDWRGLSHHAFEIDQATSDALHKQFAQRLEKTIQQLSGGNIENITSTWEQYLASWRQQRMWVMTLIALGALLSLLLASILAAELYVPFKNALEALEKFSHGNMSSRAKIYYPDAIGQVTTTLNTIADTFEGLIEQLHRTGIQLTTSTTEIAAAAKQQEVTVVEQEATTKEIAVTASEISATAKEFAKAMNSISQTAEQTSELATSGKEGLSQMELIMRQLVDASGNIASRLGILNEKASGITNVITTIAKVADQTNLLSLNASIEAEKAGEMGRSFGVIAREIRRLADQTASATVDIEKMVHEMVSAVSAAVMGVDKFSEEIRTAVNQVTRVSGVLSQIIEQVQGLTFSFENVNKGMQNQTLGAEQINEAISQLSDVAQQTSESIRQFQNAIDQLNIAARDMQASAARVKHENTPQLTRSSFR